MNTLKLRPTGYKSGHYRTAIVELRTNEGTTLLSDCSDSVQVTIGNIVVKLDVADDQSLQLWIVRNGVDMPLRVTHAGLSVDIRV